MFTFINIISCFIAYYMYEKTNILQRRIDYLEYEMTNLTNVLFLPSAPLLKYSNDETLSL